MGVMGFGLGLLKGVGGGIKAMGEGLYDLGTMSVDGYKQAGQLAKELYDSPQAREETWQALKQMGTDVKQGALQAARDPKQTFTNAKNGVLAGAKTAKDVGQALLEREKQAYADAARQGKGSEFVGEATGRVGFEIGILFIGVGEASAAGKAGEASKLAKMGKLETIVLPCGKVVTKAEFEAAEAMLKTPKVVDPILARRAANEGLWSKAEVESQLTRAKVSQADLDLMRAKKKPLGFSSEAQFKQFQKELSEALEKSGLPNANVGLKGSSTTFFSEHPKKPLGHHWDANPLSPGDYDLNITDSDMLSALKSKGVELSPEYNIFSTRNINREFPELGNFSRKWSRELGRPVNIVGLPSPTPPVRDPTEFLLKGD